MCGWAGDSELRSDKTVSPSVGVMTDVGGVPVWFPPLMEECAGGEKPCTAGGL